MRLPLPPPLPRALSLAEVGGLGTALVLGAAPEPPLAGALAPTRTVAPGTALVVVVVLLLLALVARVVMNVWWPSP